MRPLPQGNTGWRRLALRWLAVLLLLALGGSYVLRMPGHSHSGPLKPLTDGERQTRDRLAAHVERLAGDIGERNMWRRESLAAAAGYIEAEFRALGFAVASQTYRVSSPAGDARNLEIEIAGTGEAGEMVVVGAHYDSVLGSPGANDNGSGVAALIELGRMLRDTRFPRGVRLVAFVNEEPPFFTTGEMGSQVHVRRARERGERIAAMLSLETIGYFSDAPGSQQYPAPLGWIYPDTGNFIGFVGNLRSAALVRRCVDLFRRSADFPSEGGAFPGLIPGVSWSDHASFWEAGYPALMVTDTAFYRYPHYHSAEDLPQQLDYGRMARVVHGLAGVVAGLAAED